MMVILWHFISYELKIRFSDVTCAGNEPGSNKGEETDGVRDVGFKRQRAACSEEHVNDNVSVGQRMVRRQGGAMCTVRFLRHTELGVAYFYNCETRTDHTGGCVRVCSNEFKDSIEVAIGLLRSQPSTNINYHFLIVVKSATPKCCFASQVAFQLVLFG
jgi:hypothetical protein